MIYDDKLSFSEYFTYHPVVSKEREIKHNKINHAAMDLAQLVWDYLPINDPQRNEFLNQIQYIRMMLNQQATVDELLEEKPSEAAVDGLQFDLIENEDIEKML